MNSRLNKTFCSICFCLISFNVFPQTSNVVGLKAKIEIVRQDRLVSISGYAENESPSFKENISYRLLVLKKNKTGNFSKNLQSGDFSILSNQKKLLSNIKINLQKGEILKIYLYLRKNNVLIDRDTVEVKTFEKELNTSAIKEKNIEIRGLVIDEALTKPGKDFYDFFYQLYNTSGANYPFIIKINEKPGIGISSQIIVKVGDRIVNRFFIQPKEDFLRNKAQQTLKLIENYNKYRKNIFKSSNY